MESDEKDVNNNDEGVYSPMVKIRKEQEVKMIEDNFEITNRQADPDYEAIHFSKSKKHDDIRLEGIEDLNIETFDRIETNSVLNFSSEKRDLVLGIIRKPEIKPLTVFNKERGGGLDSSRENSLEIEVDVNMEEREGSTGDQEDQGPSETEDGEAGDDATCIEEAESIIECPAITKNPFLKNNLKLNQHHKFKRSNIEKKQSKVVPKKFPFRRTNSENSNNSKTSSEECANDMTIKKAAALIKQFNNGGSSGKHSEGCSGESSKTPGTKKLINKFNSSEKKPTFCPTNYPGLGVSGVRSNHSGSRNTQTKVQQMVSAFNKSNFLQNKTDE